MTGFESALLGRNCWLELCDGTRVELPTDRWRDISRDADEVLLRHCVGPTLDLGCGPGRLTAALTDRGVPALGVDSSAIAVALTRSRGAAAVRRDVFAPLPAEGRWHHVLLADGNIGIGGDPVRLLRRTGALLRTGGSALVEVDEPGLGVHCGQARVDGRGGWFDWARLGADAVAAVATEAGLVVRWLDRAQGRWFTELGAAA